MDIQRKAFESAMQELSGGQTKNDVNPVTGEYQYGVMQVMWSVWQKAQAVPEGSVLVPMVPSERMVDAVRKCYEGEAYLPYSLYSEFINQAMIESQEQKG